MKDLDAEKHAFASFKAKSSKEIAMLKQELEAVKAESEAMKADYEEHIAKLKSSMEDLNSSSLRMRHNAEIAVREAAMQANHAQDEIESMRRSLRKPMRTSCIRCWKRA